MTGFVVWFTGLSGSGKSTLAAMLASELARRGVHVEVLDGDEVRTHLSKGLTFSREDRDTNIRRIGFVAKLIARSGGCAMTAAISPFRAVRDEQRAKIERFVEVYCRASIPALAERDVKGLYKKALAGEIKGFTGIDDPYEEPEAPELVVATDRETKEQSLAAIVAKLEALGYVPRAGEAPGARAGSGLVRPHGGELARRASIAADATEAEAMSSDLPRVVVDAGAHRSLRLLATGALSPLRGFMNAKDYRKVLGTMHLETGLPWALPVVLAVPDAVAQTAVVGARVALTDESGWLLAVMEVDDVFAPDRALELRELGASAPEGTTYLGGEVTVLSAAGEGSPSDVRARLDALGASRVAGFATPGPMLRGDEHATKTALEACDALLVRVLEEGPPGLALATRREACEALVKGYYAAPRVVVAPGPGAAFATGREALHQAIVLKNHGASDAVLAPASDGERAAIEAVLARFAPGQLGVNVLVLGPSFYARATRSWATARTAPDDGSPRDATTVTDLIAAIAAGAEPSDEVIRPEVLAVLKGAALVERGS